jgi:subfamily B ATP-binding cassette protein MsbA
MTKEYSGKLSTAGHDFNGLLIQAINNFKYMKATNSFKKYYKMLRHNIFEQETYSFKMGVLASIGESIREPMIIVVIAIVIIIQVNVIGGNFGSIMVSLLLFYRSLAYLVNIQNVWNSFLGSSGGLDSVESILKEFNDSKEPINENKIENIKNIVLTQVGIQFGNKKILKNINLNIPSKNTIALVGESGAGKTTLANVISGLQSTHKGTIYINGDDLYQSNLDSYRNKIGYITQEPVIFNDSIFNNVTFWADKNEENIKKFYRTIEMVSLKNFVENLENKEESKLGNNGILISGGQKQRISIARELYKDVELMILDEATSALDSETEKFIKENIDALHGNFTMVIIAHRLSTIKNVDMVYLMENGEITDYGTFSTLVKSSDKFKKMVELQEV